MSDTIRPPGMGSDRPPGSSRSGGSGFRKKAELCPCGFPRDQNEDPEVRIIGNTFANPVAVQRFEGALVMGKLFACRQCGTVYLQPKHLEEACRKTL